jgi:predicted DsbA family dithiol-disulfide isomerase
VTLTLYGDFNCPFSALASARVAVLQASGRHRIEWRAVQHDAAIPLAGELVAGEVARALATEVAKVEDLSAADLRLQLTVPSVRSNTALASEAFAAAGTDAHPLRERLFAAVWADSRNLGDPVELRRIGAAGRNDKLAREWQERFDALPLPMTPTLVLSTGEVLPGLDALARLADLATKGATS